MAGSLDGSLRALADKFVEAFPAWQPELDHSIGSGEALDRFVDSRLATGDPMSEQLIMGIGAYLGETFIRNIGGRWTALPPGLTPLQPGIRWKGLNVLPFAEVRKRVDLGSAHSLGSFLHESADAAPRTPDHITTRWRSSLRKA